MCVASVVGLALGRAARERAELRSSRRSTASLPTTGIVFATRTVVVACLVGIGVTVLAGLFPAIRATRVPPISAVREGADAVRAAALRGTCRTSPWC